MDIPLHFFKEHDVHCQGRARMFVINHNPILRYNSVGKKKIVYNSNISDANVLRITLRRGSCYEEIINIYFLGIYSCLYALSVHFTRVFHSHPVRFSDPG